MPAGNRRPTGGVVALAGMLLGVCGTATAQEVAPPPDAPVQLGPIFLEPSFELRDVGVDSNVLNAAEPQSDFTATLGSGLDATMLAGPARIRASSAADYIYYDRFVDQRSLNLRTGGQIDLITTRLRPWVAAEFQRTRERQGLEIDTRALRTLPKMSAGVDVDLTSRVSVVGALSRQRTTFGDDAQVEGVPLAAALDHRSAIVSLGLQVELTPLTTLLLNGERQHDRFELSPIRDTDSHRVVAGVRLDPDAIVSGEASVGYRAFEPLDRSVPEYRGLVVSAAVAYTLLDATRVGLQFDRDVAYSFESTLPYYVQHGGTAQLTQRVAGPLEVVVRAGRHRLRYQALAASRLARVDRVTMVGGGVGYRFGANARIGLDVELVGRRSNTDGHRDYDRTRVFTSVAYGR